MARYILHILLLIALITTPLAAEAQNDRAEAQRRRMEQYKKELNETKAEVESLKREKKSAKKEVAALDKEVRLRSNYIGELDSERTTLLKTMAGYAATIDSLDKVLKNNREIYAEAIRVAYRNYVQNNNTNYILASQSITEAAHRKAEIEHITASRKNLADTIIAQTEKLMEQRAILAARNIELDSISNALKAERRKLEDSRTAAQRAFNRLTKREKEAINEQRKQQKQYDQAVAELQKLLKGNKVGSGFSRNTHGLNLPVEGGVLTEQGFGGTITGKKGAAVKTIYDGIVQEVQYKKVTNKYTVFLGYNEYLVTYTNLSAVNVKKGDVVKKDQKIGTIGSGIDSDDLPYVRIAIYDCETKKPLTVSSFFKKK